MTRRFDPIFGAVDPIFGAVDPMFWAVDPMFSLFWAVDHVLGQMSANRCFAVDATTSDVKYDQLSTIMEKLSVYIVNNML